MIKEIDILELRSALETKSQSLANLDKVLTRLQTSAANLKSLEEQRLRELQSLSSAISQLFGKGSFYKEFVDSLLLAFEKEKLELQQTVF